jgi:DNA mismatch endonuclease, patch repair protein
MVDVHTPEQRSHNMAAIRSKNTKPEIAVRKIAHSMGFRFRLHSDRLPGKPDLVFTRKRKVVLVHGCYWHMHSCKYGRVKPKTNAEFWKSKRELNVVRDKKNVCELERMGWETLVLWECQTKDTTFLRRKLNSFLTV